MVKKLGTIYDSDLWLQDVNMITESLPELGELEGKSVLVTGSNGLICSAVVDVLMRYNDAHGDNIGIIAAGRNEERINERFKPFLNRKSFRFMHYDALSPEPIDCDADFVIHGANNAHPVAMSADPVGTIMGSFIGTNTLLKYVINDNGGGAKDYSTSQAAKFTGRGQKEIYSPSPRMITDMLTF